MQDTCARKNGPAALANVGAAMSWQSTNVTEAQSAATTDSPAALPK